MMRKFLNILENFKSLQKGYSTINEYSFEKTIGEGGFGKVKLAKKKGSNEKFAIKILKKSILKRKKEFVKIGDGI